MHPATAQSPTETIPAQPVLTARESEDGHHFEWIEYARVALVAIAAAVAWTRAVPQFHGFDFISLAAALIGGYPVFEEATLFAHRERGVLPQNYEHGLPHLRLALLCFTAGAMAPPGAGGRLSVHPSAENPLSMRASQD